MILKAGDIFITKKEMTFSCYRKQSQHLTLPPGSYCLIIKRNDDPAENLPDIVFLHKDQLLICWEMLLSNGYYIDVKHES